MKKALLKKIAKGASVALLVGGMLGGANLTANGSHVTKRTAHSSAVTKHFNKKNASRSAAYEEKGIRKGLYNSHRLGVAKSSLHKPGKLTVRKGTTGKTITERVNSKRTTPKNKKNRTRHYTKRNQTRKLTKRINHINKRITRRAYKPVNHQTYRHAQRRVRNFRHTTYYYRVWNRAKNINVKGVRYDQSKLNKLYQIFNKKLTKSERRSVSSSIKSLKHMVRYLNWYINHDNHMLSLAK